MNGFGQSGCGCGAPMGRLGQSAPQQPNPTAGFVGLLAIMATMGALYWWAGRRQPS